MGMGGPVTQAPSMGRPLERHQGCRGRPSLRRVQLATVPGICSRKLVLAWDMVPGGGGGARVGPGPQQMAVPRGPRGGPGASPPEAESWPPSPMFSDPSVLPRGSHWVRAP